MPALIAFGRRWGIGSDDLVCFGLSLAAVHVLGLFILIPELAWTCLGTFWAFADSSRCPNEDITVVRAAVIVNWSLFLVFLISTYCLFDPLGSLSLDGHLDQEEIELAQRVWERRCRWACCCNRSENNTQAYSELGAIFSAVFLNMGTVPSDIAAGLVLVHRQQEESQLYANIKDGKLVRRNEFVMKPIDLNIREDKVTIRNLAHYSIYAKAAYGWPFYLLENYVTGQCRLCKYYRLCSCIRKSRSDVVVLGDNCCLCNYSAIKATTQLSTRDIIYVSYVDKNSELPFFVAVDRKMKSIVVSIRGTLSLHDTVTDLRALPEELNIYGVEDAYAHSGIYESAKKIKIALEENVNLKDIMDNNPEHKLVIVGHSLGAGAAAILSVLMLSDYPQLMCYAYSPPGGLLSLSLSRYCQRFVISAVYGKDFIARLSLQNVIKLRTSIMECLRLCMRPKVLTTGCCCYGTVCCQCCAGRDLVFDDIDFEDHENNVGVNNNGFSESMPILNGSVSSGAFGTVENLTTIDLFLPGRIVYVMEDQPARYCGAKSTSKAFWSEVEAFDTILVASGMIADHLPYVISDSLQQLALLGGDPDETIVEI